MRSNPRSREQKRAWTRARARARARAPAWAWWRLTRQSGLSAKPAWYSPVSCCWFGERMNSGVEGNLQWCRNIQMCSKSMADRRARTPLPGTAARLGRRTHRHPGGRARPPFPPEDPGTHHPGRHTSHASEMKGISLRCSCIARLRRPGTRPPANPETHLDASAVSGAASRRASLSLPGR